MSVTCAPSKSLALTNDALYAYVLQHEPPEHHALRSLRETTRQMENGFMQIPPDQGCFMAFLLKLIGARRVLEVGMFTGYSALASEARDLGTTAIRELNDRIAIDERVDRVMLPLADGVTLVRRRDMAACAVVP